MDGVPESLALVVGDPNIDTLPLTVTITDTTGTLTALAAGAATVGGSGTDVLTLTGDITDLNEELQTLAYTATSVGSETISVTVLDQHHASVTRADHRRGHAGAVDRAG